MKKEFIKTVVLTCLVVSSLVLSAHIWNEKELWSTDYNSFVHFSDNFSNRNRSQEQGNGSDIQYWKETVPEFISYTYGSQRTISYQASPEFVEAYEIAIDILSSVEKNGTLSTITEEEYLNAYKTNSMMLKFSSRINLQEFLGKDDAFFDTVSNPISYTMVVGIGDSKNSYLTFMNDSSGEAYRLPVSTTAKVEPVRELIAKNPRNASFAYELNFDTDAGNTERILFDRFVPIVLEPTAIRKLEAEPVGYSSSYDSVFKAFHIVKNSARSYRDKAGAIHFIENRSTLKILEEGSFHFETGDPEAGIVVGGVSEKEAVTEFANLLYRDIVPDSNGYLRVFSHYEQDNQHIYELMYHTPNGFLYQKDGPAVRVVCENGIIVEYEQKVLRLTVGEDTTTITGVIEAYDFLYKQPDISAKSKEKIKGMFPCNLMENGTISFGWFCQFSDGSVSCFIP